MVRPSVQGFDALLDLRAALQEAPLRTITSEAVHRLVLASGISSAAVAGRRNGPPSLSSLWRKTLLNSRRGRRKDSL